MSSSKLEMAECLQPGSGRHFSTDSQQRELRCVKWVSKWLYSCRPCYHCDNEQKHLKSGRHSKFRRMWFFHIIYMCNRAAQQSVWAGAIMQPPHELEAKIFCSDVNGWQKASFAPLPVGFMPSTSWLKPVGWAKRLDLCPLPSFHLWGATTGGKEAVFVHRSTFSTITFFSFMCSTLKDKRQQGKVPPLHCLCRYEGSCAPHPLLWKRWGALMSGILPEVDNGPVRFPRTCLVASKVVVYGDLELLAWQQRHCSQR